MDPSGSVGARFTLLIDEARRLVLASLPMVIGFVAVLAAAGTIIDVQQWNTGGDMALNFASVAAGFMLVTALITNGGLAPDGLRNGFWSYFGMSILINLGTALGLLVLVIPGIIVLVRWSGAYGYSLAGGQTVTDAMASSWAETAQHFWPILLTLMFPMAAYALGLALIVFGGDEMAVLSAPVALASNVLLFAASAASTVIGISVYSLLGQPDTGLAEVFD